MNRSKFTLELYAYRRNTEKLLYATRVGLGSPQFPTPRGSYFLMRIYDDRPLWIPPQNRWWAWGQRPSHSVYGGHMMPFFKKVRDRSAVPEDDGLDLVAPKMKMVDAGMYRIHGTDSPWSVGSGQSHGCVRMLNSTVEKLADKLKMYAGTTTRGHSANGTFVNLARPVKLVLY
ncbi:MAG: L,D-transpeptidase [Deltaproteobacteria bacterium]